MCVCMCVWKRERKRDLITGTAPESVPLFPCLCPLPDPTWRCITQEMVLCQMSGWVGVRCTRVRVPNEGSGRCGRLRLRQSNDISLTTCNLLSLLSALFSLAELNVLVMKRAIKFGRGCRRKRKDVQYTWCCAICPQPHILMSVLSYPGINIHHNTTHFEIHIWQTKCTHSFTRV